MVFITHDISFPAPPARTHSSYTPVTSTHTLLCALSSPHLPRRPSLPSSLSPFAGLPSILQSVAGERNVNRGKKGNKTSFPPRPTPLSEPHPPPHLHPLPPTQGFPFAESLNDLSWGQLELGGHRRLWEVRGRSRMDAARVLWGSRISVAKIRSRGSRWKGPNYVTWVVCSWATRDPHPRPLLPSSFSVLSLLQGPEA